MGAIFVLFAVIISQQNQERVMNGWLDNFIVITIQSTRSEIPTAANSRFGGRRVIAML